jgi:putative chitinase
MLLKKGSSGEEVKKLQSKLGLTPDGVFGAMTETQVKKWQSANGLVADGICGETTLTKMGLLTASSPAPAAPVASVGGLKLDKLKGHIPESVIAMIPDTAAKFGINTPLRLAHFLSQCGHESGGFKVTSENLNYSADGLKKIFPKYFPGNLSESYAKKPEMIASKVYGGRMGNGPEQTKDGYKFRGRGYIQLTGRDNYVAFSKAINEDLTANPDLVSTKYPLLSAAWFFQRCLAKCDLGATDAAVESVTKCVNGGKIGLADRLKHFKEYYALLS